MKTFIKIKSRSEIKDEKEENGKIAIQYRGFYAFDLILSSSIMLINIRMFKNQSLLNVILFLFSTSSR